jgi:glycosyltransferase involved in cell wall biosynthesis
MIVKNEAENLGDCLRPVRELFAEMIVVDTGSTDPTKALAEELGAKTYDFPWVDDFSAARNAALEQASGDWVFWLDADDRVDDANVQRLQQLFAGLAPASQAFITNCLNVPRHTSDGTTVISHARLFQRHPEIRWRGRVHEQILPAIQRCGHELVWTDISIWHHGYRDPVAQQRKANRDLRLLRMEYALSPKDPCVLYNLGFSHLRLGQYEAAFPFLQRSWELAARREDWVRKLCAGLIETLVRLNRHDEALRITAVGLENFPHDPELSFRRADLLGRLGDLGGAEACLRALLANPPSNYLMSGVLLDAVRKEGRRLLGVVCLDQHRHAEAEQLFREVLADFPDYLQVYVNLGYLLLARRQLDALHELIQQLLPCPEGDVYASGLQAELDMARGHWEQARSVLGQAIAAAPRMIWPRIVLSDCLLRMGDRQGFQAVQRDILRLDPGNLFAINNLRRMESARQVETTPEQPLSWTIVT